jgi:NAD(P)-dependent dehydrogenase (short-subunit alcohol dehydrogenase family)
MTVPSHHLVVEPPPADVNPFPPGLLAGRVALVTGGGSGLGLGMAKGLVQAGAAVALVGRSLEKTQAAAAAITAAGGRAIGLSAEVRDPDALAAEFDAAEDALGGVSILANNAGANFPVLAETMSPNAWRAVTRIAIDGTFFASTEFARRLIAREQAGAIVNNSAQYVWSGFPGDAHSAAAKSAIVTMTSALAAEWKPHRIRVNCIAAGFFPHAASTNGDAPEVVERLAAMMPMGRVGRMQELGWAAAFLASSLADGITGETLVIDGAERLRRQLMQPAFVPPRDRNAIWGDVT